MTSIYCAAKLKIGPGKLEELKRLMTKCMEIARARDQGTLPSPALKKALQDAGVSIHRPYISLS